jgi:hypothetical protein
MEIEKLVDDMILDIIKNRKKIINWLIKGKQPCSYLQSKNDKDIVIEYLVRIQKIVK